MKRNPWIDLCRQTGLLACALALGPQFAQADNGRPPVPVVVTEVREQAVRREVSVAGSVVAQRAALLSATVAGRVESLHVDDGAMVAENDVLLELDAKLARQELAAARAATRAGESRLEDARRRLQEVEKLRVEKAIARTEVIGRGFAVAEAEAILAQLQAEERQQEELLRRHTLRAPFAGVVSRKRTELGEWVEPGTGVLDLVTTGQPWIDFEVPQQYFSEITVGTPLRVTLDAAPGVTIAAKIRAIVPVTSAGARTFRVRVETDYKGVAITPGMSAHAHIDLGAGRQGVTVPRDALLRFPDGRSTVWMVDTGQNPPVARERVVVTGKAFDGFVEVTQGLEPGARVIVRGNESLRDGQPVWVAGAAD